MLATLIHISNLPLYETEKPYKLYTPTGTITNCQYTNAEVVIEDARGREAEFAIDKCGFEFVKHKSNHLPSSEKLQEADSKDPEVMDFLQKTIDWAKDHFGASRVFCVDWRLRKNTSTAVNIIKEDDNLENIRRQALAPVANMHCDYSNPGGWERVQKHLLPHELSAIKNRQDRIRIVNVWRPLKLVQDAPLVLCDRRSISSQDLLPVDQIVQNSITEEGLLLKHNKNHRWFWYSLQTPDDLALFHTWDSEAGDTVANYSPHGASLRAPVIEDALPRESVEVRLIVITPKVIKD